MAGQTKSFLLIPITSLLMGFAGCAYNQQSKFQMAFLPATPRGAVSGEVAEPPAVPPNPYLSSPPGFLTQHAVPPVSRADEFVRRADQRFQRGRREYQMQDYNRAREDFDAAVDLMLEASENNPPDRQVFEKKFDGMVDAIHRYDRAGLGSSIAMDEPRFEKAPLEDILEMTFPIDPEMKNRVREQMKATTSQLPLSSNDTVLGYIHYFSGRGHATLVAGLRRAGRYRSLIARILDEEGVPQELIHLAQAESGFIPRAVSRKAAVGMWQFVAWRGNEYGLKQSRYTDDRLDPERATRAAAKHLHDLYNHFGDWYLAIAAYNCGPGVVERAVERTGYADFWELRNRRVLPAETTNYVPIILAMTIMAKNAPEYGIDGVIPDPPLEYDTVEIVAPTNLALIGDLTDTPVSELVSLNPALLKNVAPEKYALRVPKGSGPALMASLQTIPADRRLSWRMHKVGTGETLASIGRRYNITPGSIVAANRMESPAAVEGDRLLIPAAYHPAAPLVRKAATRRSTSRAAARRGTRRRTTTAAAKSSVKKHAAAAKPVRKRPPVLTRTATTRSPAASGN